MRPRDLAPAALVVVLALTSAHPRPDPCADTDSAQFRCWLEAEARRGQ
jgi:hypothetical protein